MAKLTVEMLDAVGPLHQIIQEVLDDLEKLDVSLTRVPRHARALMMAARQGLLPGTCFRRVFWAKCDLSDASVMLTEFGYDDLSKIIGAVACKASTLAEQLRVWEDNDE